MKKTKIERRKYGVCEDVLNRWREGIGKMVIKQVRVQLVELERQRLGRVERQRKKTINGILIVDGREQGSDTRREVGELIEA